MGCVMGSFGFDLTCQDIYEAVAKKLPPAIVRAITDDMNVGIPPQQTLQEQLILCGELYETTRTQAKAIAGLDVNVSKTKLLLPCTDNGGTHDLDTLQRPEDFPTDLQLVVDGIKVAGAPVGTDDFVRQFVTDALLDIERRTHAIRGMDPQVGLGLLRICVSTAPTFLAQVTPPLLSHTLFSDLDTKIVECALGLLVPALDRTEPVYSEDRRQRAIQRLQLPIRHRCAGVTSIAQRQPIAYFASVASSLAIDEALGEHIDGLRRFAADAHARVIAVLGQSSPTTTAVEGIIARDDPNILLNPRHFVDLIMNEPDLRIQRALSHVAHTVATNRLHQAMQDRAGNECGDADLIAHCSKDNRSLVFLAPLSDRYNRLSAQDFIPWARTFLQLPLSIAPSHTRWQSHRSRRRLNAHGSA